MGRMAVRLDGLAPGLTQQVDLRLYGHRQQAPAKKAPNRRGGDSGGGGGGRGREQRRFMCGCFGGKMGSGALEKEGEGGGVPVAVAGARAGSAEQLDEQEGSR